MALQCKCKEIGLFIYAAAFSSLLKKQALKGHKLRAASPQVEIRVCVRPVRSSLEIKAPMVLRRKSILERLGYGRHQLG